MSPDEYDIALWRLEYLMSIDPAVGTAEFVEMEDLACAIDAHEFVHYPIGGGD
jgi:antitoxin component HigA of HigAB toxin-antitoxin module